MEKCFRTHDSYKKRLTSHLQSRLYKHDEFISMTFYNGCPRDVLVSFKPQNSSECILELFDPPPHSSLSLL